jgi:D-tyrosyl-tRNA(Tyr) deacylase
LFGLIGCQQHDYKAEADEAVYSIIDQKWQGNFGSKALSENEVQWLTTDGTGNRNMQEVFIEPENSSTGTVTLPTGPTVQIINFADFEIMVQHWLEEQFWP